MKKILLVIVVLIIAGGIGISLSLSSIVKKGIETKAPEILGTNVSVSKVRFSPLSGLISVEGFVVGNPEGFQSKSALNLAQMKVELDPKSIFKDVINVKEVLIDKPVITYEFGLGGNNIMSLQHNIKQNMSSPKNNNSSENTQSSSNEEKNGKKVIIENFFINEAKVQAAIAGNQETVSLPNIHLRDIGKNSNGVTFAEAGFQVIQQLNTSMAQTDLSGIGQGTLEKLGDKMQGISESIKGLFGTK